MLQCCGCKKRFRAEHQNITFEEVEAKSKRNPGKNKLMINNVKYISHILRSSHPFVYSFGKIDPTSLPM